MSRNYEKLGIGVLKDLKACSGHCDSSWFGRCKAFSSSTSRYRQPHGVFKKNLDGKCQWSVICIVICVSLGFLITVGGSWVLSIFSVHFSSRVRGVPGADAFEHVLMSALKSYSVIWDSFRAFATFAAFLHLLRRWFSHIFMYVHLCPHPSLRFTALWFRRTWFMMHPHACWISWWGAELISWCWLVSL